MKSFLDWFFQQPPSQDSPSDADRLMTIIAGAGDCGMTSREIHRCVDIPSDLVDRLLVLFVQAGQLVASEEQGMTVYKAVPWVRGLAGHARQQERKIRDLD